MRFLLLKHKYFPFPITSVQTGSKIVFANIGFKLRILGSLKLYKGWSRKKNGICFLVPWPTKFAILAPKTIDGRIINSWCSKTSIDRFWGSAAANCKMFCQEGSAIHKAGWKGYSSWKVCFTDSVIVFEKMHRTMIQNCFRDGTSFFLLSWDILPRKLHARLHWPISPQLEVSVIRVIFLLRQRCRTIQLGRIPGCHSEDLCYSSGVSVDPGLFLWIAEIAAMHRASLLKYWRITIGYNATSTFNNYQMQHSFKMKKITIEKKKYLKMWITDAAQLRTWQLFFGLKGLLGQSQGPNFPSSVFLSNHAGFMPRLLYGSTCHSSESFVRLKTG